MDLEDLRAAQVDERGTDSLQPLPATFYEQAADYLVQLRERRDVLAERTDDPFGSAEVRRLTDELETAAEVVEALYERRVGKVVKRASLAAAGMPVDDDGLTDEERALFSDLVERIEANRAAVLDALGSEGDGTPTAGGDASGPAAGAASGPAAAEGDARRAPEPPPDEPADGSADAPTEPGARGEDAAGDSREDAADEGPEPDGGRSGSADGEPRPSEAADDPDPDRLTVRITADVGEIYGVDDRVYTLGSEDVVTLPAANARPLLERGAAQRLD